jgi:hypothetical protein
VIDAAALAGRVRAWGESVDWKGWDPYDALESPAAPALTLRTAFGRRALTQLVKRSPVNLRPILGVPKARNAKAIALVGAGYAHLAAAGDETAIDPARRWLDWVSDHAGPSGAWSYHFDVHTRFFTYDRRTPNAIATSFALHALEDGAELLEDERWHPAIARGAAFLASTLYVPGDAPFFRYVPGDTQLIHNANLLAASALWRAARLTGDGALADGVPAAVETSLAAQADDGSWRYAETAHGAWIDNFHTAYVLESLAHLVDAVPDARAAAVRGARFWSDALFLEDGTPRYSTTSTYPLDAHCYASAIDAWTALSGLYPGALGRARLVAARLAASMIASDGHVYFQRRPRWTNRTPFVRWTAAPAFRALAALALAERTHAGGHTAPHARLDRSR